MGRRSPGRSTSPSTGPPRATSNPPQGRTTNDENLLLLLKFSERVTRATGERTLDRFVASHKELPAPIRRSMPPVHTHLTLEFRDKATRDEFYEVSRGFDMPIINSLFRPTGTFSVIRLKPPFIRAREEALSEIYRILESYDPLCIDDRDTSRDKVPRLQARHYPNRRADDGSGYSSFFLVDETDELTLLVDVYWQHFRDGCRIQDIQTGDYLSRAHHSDIVRHLYEQIHTRSDGEESLV